MATRQDFIPINQKLESSYNAQLLTELVYSYFIWMVTLPDFIRMHKLKS